MIVKLKNISTNEQSFDYCIIGSGPAGMTVALELEEKTNSNILLLEAGDENYTEQSQSCYEGEVIGDDYFELKSARVRCLGGSSNHWGGWCRPLDEIDFKYWPIKKNELDPYLEQASMILNATSLKEDNTLDKKNGIKQIYFNWSKPLVNFKTKYYERLKQSENLSLVLNANVTCINTNGNKITSVEVNDYKGFSTNIEAKQFVLATGGIENSRLLLWSNEKNTGKLVNKNAPLGNYWMEHHVYTIGNVLMEKDLSGMQFYSLTPQMQNKLNILNCGLRLHEGYFNPTKRLIADLACTVPTIGKWIIGDDLICGKQLRAAWEQEPLKENRIELSKKKVDMFSIPQVNLYWKKSQYDLRTVRETAIQFGKHLIKTNKGRVKLHDWVLGLADYPKNDEIAGYHHMGGTRMANNEEEGIVDTNCKVWGQENLFIAGSSVFPYAGHTNPTFTIVQLSLRLAKHLIKKA